MREGEGREERTEQGERRRTGWWGGACGPRGPAVSRAGLAGLKGSVGGHPQGIRSLSVERRGGGAGDMAGGTGWHPGGSGKATAQAGGALTSVTPLATAPPGFLSCLGTSDPLGEGWPQQDLDWPLATFILGILLRSPGLCPSRIPSSGSPPRPFPASCLPPRWPPQSQVLCPSPSCVRPQKYLPEARR